MAAPCISNGRASFLEYFYAPMSFGFAGAPRLFPTKYLEEIPHGSFFECRVAERQVRVDVVAIPPSFTVFGNVAFLQ
jgi:hypothetical protein